MTEKLSRAEAQTKGERAMVLRKQGLTPTQIAERLGTTPRSVTCMLRNTRVRHEQTARLAAVREAE